MSAAVRRRPTRARSTDDPEKVSVSRDTAEYGDWLRLGEIFSEDAERGEAELSDVSSEIKIKTREAAQRLAVRVVFHLLNAVVYRARARLAFSLSFFGRGYKDQQPTANGELHRATLWYSRKSRRKTDRITR